MQTPTHVHNIKENAMRLTEYMLLNVEEMRATLRDQIDTEIQTTLDQFQNHIGEERWSEGHKNTILEQLYYIAMPSENSPPHEIRFFVERACMDAGDECCNLMWELGYFSLNPIERLDLYVEYARGGDVLEMLRAKDTERRQNMREELTRLGHNFDVHPLEDEDLDEELRIRREWYYDCED
ncbi:MAG: hypothetical protein VXZ72_02230 [Chlamydiota bacterium]|nr:hypothetical protein [Chlamydiota bacterium]